MLLSLITSLWIVHLIFSIRFPACFSFASEGHPGPPIARCSQLPVPLGRRQKVVAGSSFSCN